MSAVVGQEVMPVGEGSMEMRAAAVLQTQRPGATATPKIEIDPHWSGTVKAGRVAKTEFGGSTDRVAPLSPPTAQSANTALKRHWPCSEPSKPAAQRLCNIGFWRVEDIGSELRLRRSWPFLAIHGPVKIQLMWSALRSFAAGA